jgi:uncharacterized protein (DUF362 family)/Pyruvate/2-oxoacid:ferredoxin oxidoreductase delta subunit
VSRVALVKCADYGSPGLEKAVQEAVELCGSGGGGLEDLVRPGDRVLLKPNLLGAHDPAKRVTTDPAVVAAMTRLVMDLGGRPFISDSPALVSFNRAAAKSGLAQVARDLGIEAKPFTESLTVMPPEPKVHSSLQIAREALEADAVINLPKLKTHAQMLLTLGVKNMFGTVVGKRKAEWHLAAGVDRLAFASLLIDIHRSVSPGFTLLDSVWGMEGNGPSNGRPRQVGLVAASTDALALDVTISGLLGVPLENFPLAVEAKRRGLLPERVELVGHDADALSVPDFQVPELGGVSPLPGPVAGLMRRRMVSKPVQQGECSQCGECVEICPAQAVSAHKSGVRFDYDLCIRCYCCQEVCPSDAIGFKQGLMLRMLGQVGRR